MAVNRTILASLGVFVVAASLIGCGKGKGDGGPSIGPPAGKTGDQWTEEDFAGSTSKLAKEGGPEFVDYCKEVGSCKLEDQVLSKFKEILAKYPVKEPEEIDHFAVVVRQGLIKNGMLAQGDPERYQYKVSTLATALSNP